jgi:hypothetical protein
MGIKGKIQMIRIILLILISTNAYADLDRVEVRTEKYISKHDTFFPEYTVIKDPAIDATGPERWSLGVNIGVDMSLKDTYWKNNIRGATTTKQFRYVGWEFEIGQKVHKNISVFYYHFSEHGLDIEKEMYPLQDSVGISFCFFGTQCNN